MILVKVLIVRVVNVVMDRLVSGLPQDKRDQYDREQQAQKELRQQAHIKKLQFEAQQEKRGRVPVDYAYYSTEDE